MFPPRLAPETVDEVIEMSATAASALQPPDVESRIKEAVPTPVKRFPVPTRRTLFVGVGALAVALGGSLFIVAPASTQTTDDAYVSADATAVAPKVRGLVAQVLVQDNQVVHAGDPLVRIDPEEFDARVATAAAELADAKAGVSSAKAALVSLNAEERLASANVRAAESAIGAAKAQADRAIADRKRYEKLVDSGAVAARDADAYRAAAITAEQDVTRVSALFDVSRDSEAVTRAKRATLEAALQKAEATVEHAHAALDLARQDQRHAVIAAPIEGVVGNRQVQQGDYVQPGTHLLTLVPLHQRYVTANFKETQTDRMQAGQHARIEVDAFPGHEFVGTVESLAPGSGSRFALLPFEPGTGNFTKIVQRVPVRIRFEPNQPDLDQLRPGLSVTVKVALTG
jgi:membrane fusion protein (multidrug efflux system)